MKRMKKILALVLAMAMTLGMAMTAFAEETGDQTGDSSQQTPTKQTTSTSITAAPDENDTAEVKILNVNENATVTAYRIVEATYNGDEGFKGYAVPTENVEENGETVEKPVVTLNNLLKPTQEEIQAIAKKINAGELIGKVDVVDSFTSSDIADGKGTFSAQLGAGYWVVLITGGAGDVYAPMLLGVYYANANGEGNTLEGGILDSDSSWDLYGEKGYAKTGELKIDKQIVNSDGNASGNDVAVGDEVSFKIDTMIPSYNDKYGSIVVKVTDTLSKGLTLLNDDTNKVIVKIDGVEAEENTNYTKNVVTNDDGTTDLTIEFTQKNTGLAKDVEITYTAKLNDQADHNFDPNTNSATLSYTNSTDTSVEPKKVSDMTYTYTFDIGAELTKNHDINGWEETEEIVKVDENGNLIVVESNTVTHPGQTVVEVAEGATFALYEGIDEQNKDTFVQEATTDEYGKLTFTGLDAGTYTLMETKAPTGFQLDSTSKHTVVIAATYNDNGTLDTYSITIDGATAKIYKATYKNNSDELEGIDGNDENHIVEIPNTKLSSLPSTGGIGTTIFTIGGCVIMILAAALFFASRRRAAK